MISESETERAVSWIQEAEQQGVTAALGGTVEGGILAPTVLLNVPPDAQVSCKEVFAPIVLINKVGSVEEAVDWVTIPSTGFRPGFTPTIRTRL